MFDGLEVAELDVLGAVLETGGRCLDDFDLIGDQFSKIELGRIFDKAREIHNHGRTVDLATLVDALPADFQTIYRLTDNKVFAGNVVHNAGIVTKHAVRRDLSALADGLKALDQNLDAAQMIEYGRAALDRIGGVQKAKVLSMPDLWGAAVELITTETVYSPSPWPSLDEAIGGFRSGALYVIGARPGMGKTIVGLQIAIALGQGGVVAYNSLEMPKEELTVRGIASHANVNVSKLAKNRLDPDEWARVNASRPEFVSEVFIDDRSSVGPSQVRQFARSVARKGDLKGIVVDYMQLMTSPGKESRQEKVSEFSRQLKILAKDLKVPVFALSQLNRESESRSDKRPQLSDLRESGSIEQDADVVILLSRDEENNDLWMDVAKNRHGATALVKMQWKGEFSKVVDYRVLHGFA
ncbi:replicative DNA helicase [Subtercola vilae]|uniref:SF4 helicase domain-containing protein n=1 Tax=Subtercola vilae TaxID=2056433 RepID=A0A4T2B9L6_9MICO|nr:DnaB-like helicase C-terminal domain-containing protein [Subtercola vilae]TIH27049.1 hypothetical protein D4765_18765 [Subtercola vilae]